MSTNALEALASCTLHDSNISPALYNALEIHPLTFFVKGTAQKREDLISHPQVESLLFLSKNNLIEMFLPSIVKEFDSSGSCTTKVGGLVGKTSDNCFILSIPTNKAFSDIITCWTKDNLLTYQKGEEIPSEMFSQTIDQDSDKPWTPSFHPVALFHILSCIIKLKCHRIITGAITKPSVRLSLQTYCHTAVDWLDVITAHKNNIKNFTYTSL